jgi:hypothetical protein
MLFIKLNIVSNIMLIALFLTVEMLIVVILSVVTLSPAYK